MFEVHCVTVDDSDGSWHRILVFGLIMGLVELFRVEIKQYICTLSRLDRRVKGGKCFYVYGHSVRLRLPKKRAESYLISVLWQ